MDVYRIITLILLAVACIVGALCGIYTFFGDVGTSGGRADLIRQSRCLQDPSLCTKLDLTNADFANMSEQVREKVKGVINSGACISAQGDWDKSVMYIQSLLLLILCPMAFIAIRKASWEKDH